MGGEILAYSEEDQTSTVYPSVAAAVEGLRQHIDAHPELGKPDRLHRIGNTWLIYIEGSFYESPRGADGILDLSDLTPFPHQEED